MSRPLKVFGYTIFLVGIEIQKLENKRQARAIVACSTKKEAMKKFDISLYEANNHMSETTNEDEIKMAISKPGQVFAYHGKDVIEIER